MSEAIIKYINAPLSEATIKDLHAGDVVPVSYTHLTLPTNSRV